MTNEFKDSTAGGLGIPESFSEFEALRNKEENWTPLMKAYNRAADKDESVNAFILVNMDKLVKKGIDPTWENYSQTVGWAALSMNLTGANQRKYENFWGKLYAELMAAPAVEVATVTADDVQAVAKVTEAPAVGVDVVADEEKPSDGEGLKTDQ